MPHGIGRAVTNIGDIYEGQWLNGTWDGFGR